MTRDEFTEELVRRFGVGNVAVYEMQNKRGSKDCTFSIHAIIEMAYKEEVTDVNELERARKRMCSKVPDPTRE